MTAALSGAPAAPFTTFGISPTRDGDVLLGFGASTAVAEATSLYLRYEGTLAGQDGSHGLTAGLRMTLVDGHSRRADFRNAAAELQGGHHGHGDHQMIAGTVRRESRSKQIHLDTGQSSSVDRSVVSGHRVQRPLYARAERQAWGSMRKPIILVCALAFAPAPGRGNFRPLGLFRLL